MCTECLTYKCPNRRTVNRINRGVISRSKRPAGSRFLYAKDDQNVIATWKEDLIRVIHVFNVRSADSGRYLLTVPFQTELAISTHIMVTDIHRNVVAGQEESRGRRPSVSHDSPFTNDRTSTSRSLKPSQ